MAKHKKESGEVVPFKPFREMERFFEDVMGRRWGLWPVIHWPEEMSPAIDLYEEGQDIVAKAELPGLKKEDIDINITENTLTISGSKEKEEKVERKDYIRVERSSGSFSRSFSLPVDVKTDAATASFKDGVLEVRIPKSEETKKRKRKIEIG